MNSHAHRSEKEFRNTIARGELRAQPTQPRIARDPMTFPVMLALGILCAAVYAVSAFHLI